MFTASYFSTGPNGPFWNGYHSISGPLHSVSSAVILMIIEDIFSNKRCKRVAMTTVTIRSCRGFVIIVEWLTLCCVTTVTRVDWICAGVVTTTGTGWILGGVAVTTQRLVDFCHLTTESVRLFLLSRSQLVEVQQSAGGAAIMGCSSISRLMTRLLRQIPDAKNRGPEKASVRKNTEENWGEGRVG